MDLLSIELSINHDDGNVTHLQMCYGNWIAIEQVRDWHGDSDIFLRNEYREYKFNKYIEQ